MTMVAGIAYRSVGFLAYSSQHKLSLSDGSVRYEDGPSAFAPFDRGLVGASGNYAVAQAAVEYLKGSGGGELAALASGLGPVLAEASVEQAGLPGVDPGRTRVVVLTGCSGSVEMGLVTARDGLQGIPPGNRVFSPPGDTDEAATMAAWTAFEEETHRPRSSGALLRALGRLYAEVAVFSPTISETVTVGVLQRPADVWDVALLEGPAAHVAEATDAEIARMFHHPVEAA